MNRLEDFDVDGFLDRVGAAAGDRPRFAVLDEDGNVISATLTQWALWFERQPQRFIQSDDLGIWRVSTVFLGLDHNYSGRGPGLYFETIVFGAPEKRELFGRSIDIRPSLWCNRCSTLSQARVQHQDGLRWLEKQDFFDASSSGPDRRAQ